MNPHSDEKIIDSWERNASQWAAAVRKNQIESRQAVTNNAVVEAVRDYSPESVIDIGCGEGWLVRALAPHATRRVGVDAIPALIEQARAVGGGDYVVAAYEDIPRGLNTGRFDVAVCNFSLMGKESVETVFHAIPSLLNPGGVFVVQTLHPEVACGELPYRDGWRDGSWAGFGSEFIDPAPWYFRTRENWHTLFSQNRFQLLEVREPLHPATQKPASILFIGMLKPC